MSTVGERFTPGEQVGPYLIEAFLGEGAVADVYGARRTSDSSRHAIKLLAEHSTEQFQRMSREASSLAMVNHPNVVHVHELIHTRLGPALVMERIDGITLKQLLETYQPTEAEAVAVFRGLMRGIAAAHRAGLIHRDLNPGNVLLKVSERKVTPMIADFGLAKEVDSGAATLTKTGMYLGSPEYLAPEQILDSKRADQRADLYALGVVLYEMVAAKRPFAANNPVVLFEAKTSGTYEALDVAVPDVARSTARWVRLLLAPDADSRPATADEVLKGMKASTSPETIGGRLADEVDAMARVARKGAAAFPSQPRRSANPVADPPPPSANVGTWVAFGLVGVGIGGLLFSVAVGLAFFAWWAA